MEREKSCGAVVYTRIEGTVYYLLVQNLRGVYGFPKGHVEGDETEVETALREIREEVGLEVELNQAFRATDSYPIPLQENITKDVVFFLACYENQTPVYQKEELSGASLHTYEEAMSLFRYERLKRILTEADEFIKSTL